MKFVMFLAGMLVGAFGGFGLALNEIDCTEQNKVQATSGSQGSQGYDEVLKAEEEGYLNGQKSAISGDIRVKRVNDQWVFIKSPWVTDTIYNSYLDYRP